MENKKNPLSPLVPVPESTYRLLEPTFALLKPASRKFLANLLDHGSRHGLDTGFAVSSKFTRNIQREFGWADYGRQDYFIISALHAHRDQNESRQDWLWSFSDTAVKGKATEYFARTELQNLYSSSVQTAIMDETQIGLPYWDLVTGKNIVKPPKERAPEDAGAVLARKAVNTINRRVFNYEAVIAHLNAIEHTEPKKWRNDCACLQTVLSRHPQSIGNGLYSYKANYRYAYTGRIYEMGGGLQGCSRLMKLASVQGVENVYNYDLENCQVRLLHHELQQHGLHNSLLDELMVTDKSHFAGLLGITAKEWKLLLLAFIFGEGKEKQIERLPSQKSVDAYHDLTAELRKVMRKWRGRITDTKKLRKYRGKYLVKNALGLTEAIGDKDAIQLSAFILQGLESYFIYTVIGLSKQYGFEVISCEHDGLMTIGEIPAEAIEQAVAVTSLTCCKLVEKDIV